MGLQINAPPGTLATLNGLSGGAHFGFGKGMGGLVGGVLKDQLGSTAMAFRCNKLYQNYIFIVSGVIYAPFDVLFGRNIDKRAQVKQIIK